MFQKFARLNGAHVQRPGMLKILHVMSHDEGAARRDSAFQQHVVIRVAQMRSPQKMDILQVRERRQVTQVSQCCVDCHSRGPGRVKTACHSVYSATVKAISNSTLGNMDSNW